jgi:hypothetical protein
MPTGLKVSYLSLPSTQARRPASSPRRFLPRLPRLHTSRFLLLFLCSASTITFILVVFPSTLINLQHFSLQSHSHSRESFDPRSLQCRPSSLSHHTPIVINSTTYLSLSPPSRPLPPPRLLPNRPLLPLACLEAQLSLGLQIPCFPPLEEGYPKVDIVWTWVNGSDPIHAETRKDKQKDFYIKASDKMYRFVAWPPHHYFICLIEKVPEIMTSYGTLFDLFSSISGIIRTDSISSLLTSSILRTIHYE